MKKLTDKLVPALALIFAAAITVCVLTAATPSNIPISGMNITTQAVEGAYFPLIQPWPGRATNDNWRIAKSNLFSGVSVSYVTNLTVYSNLYINTNIVINTNITINSNVVTTFADALWTNDAASLRPADHVTYTQLAASNTIAAGWDVNTPCYQEIIAGTTILDSTSCRAFFLLSTEPDPSLAIIRLKNGRADGARLTIYCYTNLPNTGGFTLQANSAVAVSGGQVKLKNNQDWVSTNGSMIELEYMITDWIEKSRGTVGMTNQPQELVINPTDGYLPYRYSASAFADSPLYRVSTNIGLDGQLLLGPGVTNVIYRSGASLVITNGSLTNALTLRNGIGTGFHLTYALGGSPRIVSDNSFIYIAPYALFENDILPSADNSKNIGNSSSSGAFASIYIKGTSYVQGMNDGTNYSRLEFSHSGTNSTANISSTAFGTAGGARAIQVSIGSTNTVKFDSESAAGQTRLWLYDEDNATMERVTVGDPDSGGLGYKVLRIPN